MTEEKLQEIAHWKDDVPWLTDLIAEVRRCWAIIEDLRNLFPRDVEKSEENNQ